MRKTILVVMFSLLIVTGAQAKNVIYGGKQSSLENEGYKLFISDNIVNTVDRSPSDVAEHCKSLNETNTEKLGDIKAIRADSRLKLGPDAGISYFNACSTFYSVTKRLSTPDDTRRLWLLFADSAMDDYAADTIREKGTGEDSDVSIEMKRLTIVSKYIEFFTRNKDWKLTDYTFLSQAFKTRKDKTLSPAFTQFVAALLTGDADKASQVVKSIDLDNLGSRFGTK